MADSWRNPALKVRALLADLLVHEGRQVSTDRLVDDLWGEELPGNPANALQAKVSQLRRALGRDRGAGASRPSASETGLRQRQARRTS
ncbi:AfsR/SARP family transcriptional regulator [Microtetraspora malaysiensis]|uniref:AfsR/SARP family transcriptional regulator n=1 Tax=Microtetraspora malaysiensis TaxID=161358 RepID=UPI003D8DE13A